MENESSGPQIFEADYYEKLFAIEENHWWEMGLRDAMEAMFRKAVAENKRLRVLDAGCGTGFLLEYLKHYNLSGEVVGLDYSGHALEFCRGRGASELVLASTVEPPFQANSFDLIICIDTLQHLSPAGADQVAMAAFATLLRPDGLLYLRTNSTLGHKPLEGVDPEQYRRYNKKLLGAMAQAADLHVERATYVNMIPSLWGWFREYTASNNQKTRAIGPGLTIRIPKSKLVNRVMYLVLQAEAFVIGRLGIDLPFGHSLALLARKMN